jgi:hypothetical protein
MKLFIFAAAALVLLTSCADAWTLELYRKRQYKGERIGYSADIPLMKCQRVFIIRDSWVQSQQM